MENKQYVNPFTDVHQKVAAMKASARNQRQKDELVQEQREILERKRLQDKQA